MSKSEHITWTSWQTKNCLDFPTTAKILSRKSLQTFKKTVTYDYGGPFDPVPIEITKVLEFSRMDLKIIPCIDIKAGIPQNFSFY